MTNNRQQLLFILAAVAVGLLVLDRLILTPMTKSWKERSTKIRQLKQSIAQGELLLDRKERVREQWSHMRTNTLPVNLSAAENLTLRAFDRWAEESGIGIAGIKPQWKRNQDDDHLLLDCRADAFGSLENVARFLYEAEQDPLALRVEAFEITSRDNSGQQLALGVQVTGLVLIPKDE